MHSLLPPSLVAVIPRCLQLARQPVPDGLIALRLGDVTIGWVHPMRQVLLAEVWPELQRREGALVWNAEALDVEARSARIGAVALALKERGAITGWRGERYACEQPVEDPCTERGEVMFRLERAAFRFFGLMSRAVHINGLLPGARVVCGRRALSKATDPGKLDNLAAGGLTADEDLVDCARRELLEEAGVPAAISVAVQSRGALRSTRMEAEGLHDEVLHVFSLQLPAGFSPRNGDGEVSEFLTLDLESLAGRLAAGEFSHDAAAVSAFALQHSHALADLRA
jgi:8-oxo-dGTP pyrophosphatase MutT (NUDIX family)